jgi:hypothetical protein
LDLIVGVDFSEVEGGHHESRTDTKDRVGAGGNVVLRQGVVSLTMFFSREPSVPMLMSIYVTLGIFLLLAVRDPAAKRSLIGFGGWAILAHAGVMAAQEYRNVIESRELVGVVVWAWNNFLMAPSSLRESTSVIQEFLESMHTSRFSTDSPMHAFAGTCSRL